MLSGFLKGKKKLPSNGNRRFDDVVLLQRQPGEQKTQTWDNEGTRNRKSRMRFARTPGRLWMCQSHSAGASRKKLDTSRVKVQRTGTSVANDDA